VPKTLSIGRGGIDEIENVVVPAHQIVRLGRDRRINIGFVLGIPVKLEDARDSRNDDRQLFEGREKSTDKLVR
jgi:hypothetical protein